MGPLAARRRDRSRGKRIVSPENLAYTHTPKVAVDDKVSYALGWLVQQTPNGSIIWHNGGTFGFGAMSPFSSIASSASSSSPTSRIPACRTPSPFGHSTVSSATRQSNTRQKASQLAKKAI